LSRLTIQIHNGVTVSTASASTVTEGSIPQFVAIAQARVVGAAQILLSTDCLQDPLFSKAKTSVEELVALATRLSADFDVVEAHVASHQGFLGSQAYWRFDLMGLVIGTCQITALERESGNPQSST
jgi:hypothetical protein